MNGVMMPETSAGSNQTGASETCTAQVSCPCAPAAFANRTAAAAGARADRMRRSGTVGKLDPTVVDVKVRRNHGDRCAHRHARYDFAHHDHRFLPATALVCPESFRPIVQDRAWR